MDLMSDLKSEYDPLVARVLRYQRKGGTKVAGSVVAPPAVFDMVWPSEIGSVVCGNCQVCLAV